MDAELLTIGSELTSGATVNTNAAYLARRLAALGIPCRRQISVGDERTGLAEALREALRRCDLLITTGGLGPTFDDITMATIAEVTQHPLRFSPMVAATVRRFYTRRHRQLQRAALRQAYLPQGGAPLPNPLGTAPGLWLRLEEQVVVALPGVPAEMRAIMERHVLPRLKRLGAGGVIESHTLRTAGLVELSIESILRTLRIPECVQIGLYPHLRMVDIRLTAAAPSRQAARRALSRIERPLRRALGMSVYGTGEDTLEGVVGELLVKRRRTIAVAESCTGGLVCDRLTNVPGSSRYIKGGLVAYHNEVKRQHLDVSDAMLARFGAVSAPVARKMAEGVRRLADADVGLAITGIAGPTGGTAKKPVGLVYLALADPRNTLTRRCQFFGDRLSIKTQAAQTALDFLRRSLLSSSRNQ
ncbi:MAG: competence/damage-inducible protein A [Candidatus Omnitrophica bacterium]|nr:competence/damage-inducible protein A [Candidatus Omnitrophota bacterium]